jgi:hypothetical protein
MAIRDLFFNILATDKTGNAFSAVSAKLRGVEGAAASVDDRLKRAGRGMAKFGAAASAASAGILFAFRDSIQLFDVQARAEAKVRRGIESTGAAAGFTAQQLLDMASGLQAVTRFGDESILSDVTGQLLTFTNISGDALRRAQEAVLDIATVMEVDAKSAAIQLGKALNDPVKGLSALSRSGIQFTEDQKRVIKSLVAGGEVAKAQGIILDEIAVQFGGQARAAAEAGVGPLIQFQNAWGDLKETVGGILAELLPPVVRFFQGLVDGFQALPGPVQKFVVLGGALAVALGPAVALLGLLVAGIGAIGLPVAAAAAGIAALTAGIAAFLPEIGAMAGAVGDAVGQVRTWLVDTFGPAWEAASAGVSSALDTVGGFLAAFAQAHVDAFALIARIVPETVAQVSDWLTGKLSDAFDFVIGAVGKVKGAFFDLFDAVVGNSYVPDMVDGIAQHFARLPGEMIAPAEAATDLVGTAFRTLGQDAAGSISAMTRNGKVTFEGFAKGLVDSANRMADQIIDDAFARLADASGSLFGGLFPAGPAGGGKSGGGIGGAASGFFASIFAGLPGFASGADFTVGGRGGVDRNLVAFRASSDERVTVTRPGQAAGGGAPPVVVNISTPDARSFQASRGQIAAQIAAAVSRGQRFA